MIFQRLQRLPLDSSPLLLILPRLLRFPSDHCESCCTPIQLVRVVCFLHRIPLIPLSPPVVPATRVAHHWMSTEAAPTPNEEQLCLLPLTAAAIVQLAPASPRRRADLEPRLGCSSSVSFVLLLTFAVLVLGAAVEVLSSLSLFNTQWCDLLCDPLPTSASVSTSLFPPSYKAVSHSTDESGGLSLKAPSHALSPSSLLSALPSADRSRLLQCVAKRVDTHRKQVSRSHPAIGHVSAHESAINCTSSQPGLLANSGLLPPTASFRGGGNWRFVHRG